MVWSHAIGDMALSTVQTSAQTSASASVSYPPAGTLYDDYDSPIGFDDHMAISKIPINKSKISTGTSFVTTTNTCLPTSFQFSHSTMLTYDPMCSNPTGFAQHSFNPVVPTSPFGHSILQVTRGTVNH